MKRLSFSLILAVLVVGSDRPSAAEGAESAVPVKFLRDREVSLGLYPEGFSFAAAVTVAGITLGKDDLVPLERVLTLLGNQGIRPTFFALPGRLFRENIQRHPGRLRVLRKIALQGIEISQDSPPPDRDRGRGEDPPGEIAEQRRFLAGLGLEPAGYRAFGPPSAEPLIPILEKAGYIYFLEPSGAGPGGIPPYPERFPGLRILRFGAFPDPVRGWKKFEPAAGEVIDRQGVVVLDCRLEDLKETDYRNGLRRLVVALKRREAWFASLEELGRWWTARVAVGIDTSRDGDNLVVVYDNPTPHTLQNVRLYFTGDNLAGRFFRLESRDGYMISQGLLPEAGYINATLVPTASGPGTAAPPRTAGAEE